LFLLDDVQQYNIEIVAKDKQILMAKKNLKLYNWLVSDIILWLRGQQAI
jgi:hypothetical protein